MRHKDIEKMEPIKLILDEESNSNYYIKEAFNSLRANVLFLPKDVKVIVVTSCQAHEGKSTVCFDLCRNLAEAGKRVLLVDADLRKSLMVTRYTEEKGVNGLSQILSGQVEIKDAIYPTTVSGLDIVFSGPYPPNPVELLDGEHFSNLLEECRNEFDYVIIDTPPLGQVIDAAVIAEKCDGAAIVLGSTRIHYRQAQEVVSLIEKSGCKVLGVIRNHKKISSKKYYYRKYYKSEEKTDELKELADVYIHNYSELDV